MFGVFLLSGLIVALWGAGRLCDRWSSRRVVSVAAPASASYAVLTVAMTATRFFGDRLRSRFGPVWTIQRATATGTVGYVVVIAAPSVPAAGLAVGYAGWLLVGLGLAMVVPLVFAFGYVGMLAGPSVIGPLAEATSLRVAPSIANVSDVV